MANPPPYERAYSFANWQSSNPTQPLPGQKVDIELDNVEASTEAIVAALADVRRSDGHLVNDSVHLETLDEFLRNAISNETDLEGAIVRAEEAAEAAEASEAAATAAAVNAGIARAAAEAAAAGAESSEQAALAYKNAIFALPQGTVIRETKTLLDAKIDVDENTGGIITNDPNNDYNWPRLWRKNAASGLGGWTASVDLLENIDLRLDDLENDATTLDFTDNDKYAVINSPGGTINVDYTVQVVDPSHLAYRQNIAGVSGGYFLVGVLTKLTSLRNRSFAVHYKVNQLNEATPGVFAGGIGICINPSSATVMDGAGHVTFLWRFDAGSIQAIKADSFTPDTTYGPLGVIASALNANSRPVAGDEVDYIGVWNEDGTAITVTCYRNGALAQQATITGFPAGWIGVCARNSILDPVNPVGTFGPLDITKIQSAVKRVYVSQSGSPSGIGTEQNPFSNTTDAILSANESNRHLDLVLKEGVLTAPIQIDGSQFDSISIRSDQNRRSIIRPGTVLTSGWTLTNGALYPGVYERQHVFAGVVGSTAASGSFVDLTPANADGWWGFNAYRRQAPLDTVPVDTTIGVKLTTLAATPLDQGQYLTSYQTGKAYIRCVGAQNPNGLTIYRSEWPSAVNITPPPAGRVAGYDTFFSGLEIPFFFGYGLRFGRSRAEAEDCHIYGGVGPGIAADMASGWISNCKIYRNYADGINNTIGPDWQPPNPFPTRDVSMRLISNDVTDMIDAADSCSNHTWQNWSIIGGRYSRSRAGIAAVSTYTEVISAEVHDNRVWGAVVLADEGSRNELHVRNCDLDGNGIAFGAWAVDRVGVPQTAQAKLTVSGGIATNSVTLFQTRNDYSVGEADLSNPAVIVVRDLGRAGTTGDYHDNPTGPGLKEGFLLDQTVIPRIGGTK